MENIKKNKKENVKKTWLDLTEEEIKKIKNTSACMYGRKSSVR